MGEKADHSGTNLLIDFSSPTSNRPVLTPLIPAPTAANRITLSPTTNNPFDVVARQTHSPDPFESVFKNAYHNLNNSEQNSLNSEDDRGSFNSENIEPLTRKDDINISSVDNGATIVIASENKNEITVNGTSVDLENVQSSIQTNSVKNTRATLKNSSESLVVPDGNSQSQISSDFSTEESLKAVIAKRVNKCIQKVLNNSLSSKINSKKNVKNSCNRRSLSFISLSTPYIKCDKLNKSCTDSFSQNEHFNLENQTLNSSNSSIENSDIRPLSPLLGKVDQTEDSAFLPSVKEEVFQEANKLARTFSKIAESFCQSSDNEDDLLSCKPRWLYADSSEDEEDKLRKDPALNIRVSLTNSMVLNHPDSEALSAFKSRQRRSVDHLQVSTPKKEHVMKRCNSIGSKAIEVPVIPYMAKPVPVGLVHPEEKAIRHKQRSTGDLRRGPMRAVMPVQSMTKEPLHYEDKVIANRDNSPIRKHHSINFMNTPNKDSSEVGICPMASSTPNKSITVMPHLLTPAIESPSNKRRSLGSTLDHRSRPFADTGARQRSNSASSSIPTPVIHSKVFKVVPPVKSPTKQVKSTSSLPHVNSKISAQRDKSQKKSTKQTKTNFNPRALNEVKKTHSPIPARMMAAVNTISNLVKGKGKKAVARDKENRVPV